MERRMEMSKTTRARKKVKEKRERIVKGDSESDTEREEERACDGVYNLSSVCVVVPCSPLAGRPSSHLN